MNRELLAEVFDSESTALLRTDFSDNEAWQQVIDEVGTPVNFENEVVSPDDDEASAPMVETVSDRSFEGMTAAQLAEQWDRDAADGGYVLIADAQSMREAFTGSGLTLVYVDLSVTAEDEEDDEDDVYVYGRAFRCAVREIASIYTNLDIANMDFADFANYADEHGGVFRGFS